MNIKKLVSIALITFASLSSVTSLAVNAAPVNVNISSQAQISKALTGVGPVKAQAIADYCKAKTCKTANDLLNVKGIGPATLKKIKDDLLF